MRSLIPAIGVILLVSCTDLTHPHGDVTLTGRIAFTVNTGASGEYSLWHMRPDGTDMQPIPVELSGAVLDLDVSPDGRQLLFTLFEDFSQEVFVVNADGSGLTNLTRSRSSDVYPRWSPDGRQITFASNRNSNADHDIHVMDADGGNVRTVTNDDADELWPDWSPDGATLAFTFEHPDGDTDVMVVPAAGGQVTQLTAAAGDDLRPDWSYDGASIAFTSQRDVGASVWIMAHDGSAQHSLMSADSLYGGSSPRWSPDGSSIAFGNGGTEFRIVSLAGHTIAGPFPGQGAAWGPAE